MPATPNIPAPLANLFPDASFAAKIGEGAYGQVWLAHLPGGTWRAVKFVAGDSGTAQRERRALRLLRSLADPAAPDAPLHPALLPVADLRESPAAFACSMPLADSLRPNWRGDPAQYRPRTLAADLLARRALPLPECLALAETLASALAFLQRHCLVHRDLKPSNVLYLGGRPVLADFGLLADTREAASVVGTPGYVPPEQHGDFSADLYSLGVLLSEALTGRPAAETGFAPVPEADTAHPLYPRFLALLRRATDPNPARRPQTADAFLHDLRALRIPPPAPRWRRLLLPLLLALALLALAATALHFARRPSSPPPASEPAPAPSPATPHPSTNAPLLFLSTDMADNGAFFQLYTDRIRVGLPIHGPDAENAALLLLHAPDRPPDDPKARRYNTWGWNGPVSWTVCPLLPADASNTPSSAATAPAFPDDAPALDRPSRTAIAMLLPNHPYPAAVFLLLDPPWFWESRLADHPGATFDDLYSLWWQKYQLPADARDPYSFVHEYTDEALQKKTLDEYTGGDL